MSRTTSPRCLRNCPELWLVGGCTRHGHVAFALRDTANFQMAVAHRDMRALQDGGCEPHPRTG